MSVLYAGYMSSVDVVEDEFEKTVSAGSWQLKLTFKWDSANDEQYNILYRALKARSDADPLINDEGEIEREYEWIEWYSQLPNTSEVIEELIEGGMMYPQSLKSLRNDIALMANEMLLRRQEAISLDASIQPLVDQRVWSVRVEDDTGFSVQGAVRPGGWLNNQSLTWSIRFECDLSNVGRNDLSLVQVVVEDKTQEDETV